jgi:hypothetical protein
MASTSLSFEAGLTRSLEADQQSCAQKQCTRVYSFRCVAR